MTTTIKILRFRSNLTAISHYITDLVKCIPLASWIRSKSYSQFWEDRLIKRLVQNQIGSYVDIGAGTPIWGSNTFLFYRSGWRGVTIDPIKLNINLQKILRRTDTQYHSIVSSKHFHNDLYQLYPWELSTTDEKLALHRMSNGAKLVSKRSVNAITLEEIYLRHPMKRPSILSIDVEGSELDVLQSNDWEKFKPDIICVEELQNPHFESPIREYLALANYSLALYNGVSAIYIWNGSKNIVWDK